MTFRLHQLCKVLLVASVGAAVFYAIQVRERIQLLDDLIHTAVASNGLTDAEDIALSLSDAIYRRMNKEMLADDLDWFSQVESASFFNVSSAVGLEYGGYCIVGDARCGPCGTMSRTLLNALWRLGIPARKLQLLDNDLGQGGGHTMIEFYHDGAWRVLSPSDNSFVWRTADDTIATARQIQSDRILFSQIYTVNPTFPYLFDNYAHIRWERLPKALTSKIKSLIGEERYISLETPRLYDLPRTLLMYCSLFLTILLSIIVYVTKPKNVSSIEKRRFFLFPSCSWRAASTHRRLPDADSASSRKVHMTMPE